MKTMKLFSTPLLGRLYFGCRFVPIIILSFFLILSFGQVSAVCFEDSLEKSISQKSNEGVIESLADNSGYDISKNDINALLNESYFDEVALKDSEMCSEIGASSPALPVVLNPAEPCYIENDMYLLDVTNGTVTFCDFNGNGHQDLILTGLADTPEERVGVIYAGDGSGEFAAPISAFTAVNNGATDYSDIDGDGDKDVLITGWDGSMHVTKLYVNNGGLIFTEDLTAPFTGVSKSAARFADVNSDGLEDVLLSGDYSSGRTTELYINSGGGSFTLDSGTFTGVRHSDIVFGDIDGDGDLDLFLTGSSVSGKVSEMYLNNAGVFTMMSGTTFQPVKKGSSKFSDVDGDGDLDLIHTGESNIGRIAQLYHNDGLGNFSLASGTPFIGVRNGDVEFIDIDNDGDDDLLISGETNADMASSTLYLNDSGVFTVSSLTSLLQPTIGSSVGFSDLNEDGVIDILITGKDTNGLKHSSLYLSQSLQITCIADLAYSCDGGVFAPSVDHVDVQNPCGFDTSVTFEVLDEYESCTGPNTVHLVKFTVTGGGCSESCTTDYRSTDLTAPDMICPLDIEISCSEADGDYGQPIAFDSCSDELTYSFTDEISGTACDQVITRTWTTIDACGNMGTCNQLIHIIDDEAPVIEGEVQIDVAFSEQDEIFIEATDDCSEVTITYTQNAQSGGCAGQIVRTYTAVDECGNESNFVQILDLTTDGSVTIQCPEDVSHACGEEVEYGLATGSSPASEVEISFSDEIMEEDCSTTIERTWIAEDLCMNTASCVQIITIMKVAPPVINCQDHTVDCLADIDIYEFTPSAVGACDLSVAITHQDPSIDPTPCQEVVTVVWRATDSCGNYAECEQTIFVIDDVPPTVEVLENLELNCYDDIPPLIVSAQDNCGGEVSIESTNIAEPGCGDSYTLTRNYRAVDACGNYSDWYTQVITATDNQAPVILCPDDVSHNCGENVDYGTASATDDCGTVELTFNDEVMQTGCEVIIVRTWTAADECMNSSSCEQEITITDNQPPVVTPAPDLEVDCGSSIPELSATASDLCSEIITWESSIQEDENNPGVVIRTYRAIDECGNASLWFEQMISTLDLTPPTISCPEDIEIACGEEAEVISPIASDNCGSVSLSYEDSMNAVGCLIETTRTWTATDEAGNESTCSQIITMVDNEGPVFGNLPPSEVVLDCDDELPSGSSITATDNCSDDVEIIYSDDYNGYEPIEGALDDCEGIQPVDGGDDWAMIMFGLPGATETKYDVAFSQVTLFDDDGNGLEALVTGTFYSQENPNAGWYVNIPLTFGLFWEDWSNQEFPTSFKDDFLFGQDEYENWVYYLINSTGAYIEGWGDYAGSYMTISHAPSNYYFGWQQGIGANNLSPGNGIGGWMHYEGNFMDSSAGINESEISGFADVALDLDCCPQYEVTRTWTAADCSGNESTYTQTFTFSGLMLQDSCPTDLNNDGQTSSADLMMLLQDFGCLDGDCPYDVNGDGNTTASDLTQIIMNYGQECN